MQALRWPYLWLGIGWLLVVTVVTLSLLPGRDLPDVPWSDKLSHFVAYGALGGWYALIFRSRGKRIRSVIGLMLLGAGLELVQGWGGYRHAEWADMGANAVGVILGSLLVTYLCPDLLVRIESLLVRYRAGG